jgi:thiol-disulfide isomerase/thioredoxin
MIERLLFASVLLVLGWGVYQWVQFALKQRVNQLGDADLIRAELKAGVSAVVYFTTPHCVVCRTQQQPALQALEQTVSKPIQIIKIDATKQPELATRWGVMSVPTTFVMDGSGKTLAINHGVADVHKLRRQINDEAIN